MNKANVARWLLGGALAVLSGCAGAAGTPEMPHLEKRDGMTKLIVDGRPFVCIAGELANSTSTDVETMKDAWPRFSKMNLNTILSPISWELIEPQEGRFNFWLIDYQLEAARANHLHLVFLWMGSWKNAMSTYAPEWVKTDSRRFPRVVDAQGHTFEMLSTLSQANRDADARAFAAVMKHIREVDSRDHTVIAMQVENEVGVISSARDFCPAANAAFAAPIPRELSDYLAKNKDNLRPEFKQIWTAAGGRTTGTWEEVFGKNVPPPANKARVGGGWSAVPSPYNHTDEFFMAWNYAQYMGHVAAQGKKEYAIPMYVNAWLEGPGDRPGDYPCGGPEPLVHDLWHAGAPAIDILAPDIYDPEYALIMSTFARNGNPAFNPEARQITPNIWTAITQLNCLCFSHMGIDNFNNWYPDSPFARTTSLLGQLSGAIAQAQGQKDAIRLIPLAPGQNPGRVEMGGYLFDFTGGRDGAAAPPAAPPAPRPVPARAATETVTTTFLDNPFVLIIRTEPNEYYFATNSYFPFRVSTNPAGDNTASAASIDQGYFQNGQWVLVRRLSGDDFMTNTALSGAAANHQSGSLIPLGSRGRWNVPIAPAGGMTPTPAIYRVRFYQYR